MMETPYRASRLFRVLANPLAYQVISLLRGGPSRPCALAAQLKRPPSSIARVARELKMTDLIRFVSIRTGGLGRGRAVEYRLKDETVETLMATAEQFIQQVRVQT